jgi:hypothetical protein
MWITDIDLGSTYVFEGKPVVVMQTSTLIGSPDDVHTVVVVDPVTNKQITCKPHQLQHVSRFALSTAVDTLQGARNILTLINKHATAQSTGSFAPGTEVLCLRANNYGYYMPCTAHIVKVTPNGRVTVDLWTDRSERITVTKRAILWPSLVKDSA